MFISVIFNELLQKSNHQNHIYAGHAENALPQTATATVNCRMLPDDSPENVLSVLKTVLADSKISVTCTDSSSVAPLSPLREDITGPVSQITSTMWPGVTVSPVMSTGATDGKYLRMYG